MTSPIPTNLNWQVYQDPNDAKLPAGITLDTATHKGVLTMSLNTGFCGFKMQTVVVPPNADGVVPLRDILTAIHNFYLQPTSAAEITEMELYLTTQGEYQDDEEQVPSIIEPLRTLLGTGVIVNRCYLVESTNISSSDFENGILVTLIY